MKMTTARISLIFDLSVMFLSFQMVTSLFIAADVCAILDMISGFDPSDTTAPRYLNLLTVLSFYFTLTAFLHSAEYHIYVKKQEYILLVGW